MLVALLLALLPQNQDFIAAFPDDGHRIARPGLPGTLCVFGPEAAAVLTSGGSPVQAVAAAASADAGRVFAIAHNGYLEPSFFADEDGMMVSALDWLRGDAELGRVAFLSGSGGGLANALTARGYAVVPFSDAELESLQLLIVAGEGPLTPERQAVIETWIRGGGTVLAAICPWGWQQINGRRGWQLSTDMAANQILASFGLLFTDGYADAVVEGGFMMDRAACASVACQVLVDGIAAGETPHSLAPLESALRVLPPHDTLLLPRLLPLLPQLDGEHAPTPQTPMSVKEKPLTRLAVVAWDRRLADATPEDPLTAPGADSFPGAVPAAAVRRTRTLALDPQQEGWQSTGLYLAPGEVLQLQAISGSFEGWRYRIGAHSDSLWHKDRWPRWPQVSREGELAAALTSPFGGLLYLQVGTDRDLAAELTLEVQGAVAAPWWRSGQTSAAEWRKSRAAPAPWAELQGEYLILTVPSRAVRELEDPAALMAWWDQVVAGQHAFAGEDPPQRPERFVADVLISAGYMHSGYPIMMHLDVAEPRADGQLAVLLDLEELKVKGNWGCFHELGHNRQRPEWTFQGTGEVTNNLFSLYCGEVMSGIEPWTNPWLEGQKQAGLDYLADGADFDAWRRKPGVALLCYAQVQKEFGWEPLRAVLRVARELQGAERPADDGAKRSFWVRTLSLATGRDLRAFHQHWGWPLEEELLGDEALDALPEWMPDFAALEE